MSSISAFCKVCHDINACWCVIHALSWFCRNIPVFFFLLSCCEVCHNKVNEFRDIVAVYYIPIPCCEFVATFLPCALLKSL